jgi:hypothetical protein
MELDMEDLGKDCNADFEYESVEEGDDFGHPVEWTRLDGVDGY